MSRYIILYWPDSPDDLGKEGFWLSPGSGTTKNLALAHRYDSPLGASDTMAFLENSNRHNSIRKQVRAGTFWREVDPLTLGA